MPKAENNLKLFTLMKIILKASNAKIPQTKVLVYQKVIIMLPLIYKRLFINYVTQLRGERVVLCGTPSRGPFYKT